ncbi:hypothetical protein [Escherichia coli]|uniref:hypothetical protein n=1 Tax=Escherichia coli TaxID=562 RepID=UPI001FF57E3E|nr:hypothetical protein [Escherichia coli]UOY86598.1 hypothetical protein MWN28_26765 [Escherichia coli]
MGCARICANQCREGPQWIPQSGCNSESPAEPPFPLADGVNKQRTTSCIATSK